MWRKSIALLTTALFVSVPLHAFAWGPEGHELVGSIADNLLNDHAKQEVSQILGVSLQSAGPWADCIRSVSRGADGTFTYTHNNMYDKPCVPFETTEEKARMEDYASRNWTDCDYAPGRGQCHAAYHFADIPEQRNKYSSDDVGASDHDVVHAVEAAIDVLEGKPAPAPFSIKDKKEALFLLTHFVGDMHQPLHVGAVYLGEDGSIVNPKTPADLDELTETRGGNSILEESAAKHPPNLHHEWDAIPKKLEPPADDATTAEAKAVPTSPGVPDSWPQLWATDTIKASHTAFTGLTFSGDGPHKWTVHEEDRRAYLATKSKLQEKQLAKAGARLAQILKYNLAVKNLRKRTTMGK